MEYANIDKAEAEQGKIISIIGYFGILFLVPLIAGKDNKFALYHANQALLLFLLSVVASILAVIPLIGWLITLVVRIFTLICIVLGILNVVHLEARPLPIIGNLLTIIKSY